MHNLHSWHWCTLKSWTFLLFYKETKILPENNYILSSFTFHNADKDYYTKYTICHSTNRQVPPKDNIYIRKGRIRYLHTNIRSSIVKYCMYTFAPVHSVADCRLLLRHHLSRLAARWDLKYFLWKFFNINFTDYIFFHFIRIEQYLLVYINLNDLTKPLGLLCQSLLRILGK